MGHDSPRMHNGAWRLNEPRYESRVHLIIDRCRRIVGLPALLNSPFALHIFVVTATVTDLRLYSEK